MTEEDPLGTDVELVEGPFGLTVVRLSFWGVQSAHQTQAPLGDMTLVPEAAERLGRALLDAAHQAGLRNQG